MICEAMREQQDFSALPILADALDDCGRSELATICRGQNGDDWPLATRLVAQAMGGEVEEAVKWIDEFVDDVNDPYLEGSPIGDLTYERILEILRNNVNGEWDYFSFYGFHAPDRCQTDREELWKQFFIATGLPPDPERDDVPFSCSC
jgi:hypothetical protein